jgi:hypothetical protein
MKSAKKKDEPKDITFLMPKGYIAPKNIGIGEDYVGLATYRLEKDGKVTLVKMEGLPLGKTEEPDEDETVDSPAEEKTETSPELSSALNSATAPAPATY